MPSDDKAVGEFSVSLDNVATAPLTIDPHIRIGDTECDKDFVVIPQGKLASDSDSAPKDRYYKLLSLNPNSKQSPNLI